MKVKRILKYIINKLGVDCRMISSLPLAGSSGRPIGEIKMFLQDLKARGFVPKGILDVGAHRGDWARMALSVYPSAPMLMIEPQSEMASSLKLITTEFEKAEFIAQGVGRYSGVFSMNLGDGDQSGSSFLSQPVEGLSHTPLRREMPVTTIDAILQQREREFSPDLVKLDIQGFELEALSGGEKLFGRTEVFIIETSLFQFLSGQPLVREVMIFMAERGYEIYDIPGCVRRPYDGALGQIDLAFVKTSGFLRSSNLW